jgi:hypothetical protein
MSVVPYDAGALARADRGGFAADWLLDPAEIANRIGGTDFVPKALRNNPAAITAALLYGAEVGLGRMQSLAKIAVIDGKPTLAAEAQRALILAGGHDLWVEESTNTRCTIAGRRRGSEMTSRVTWTLDDAKRAKIAGRTNWQAYPRQMLLARASAELARSIFADVIGGLAATEELEDLDADYLDPNDPETPRRAAAQADADAAAKPATRRRSRRVGTTASSSSSTPKPPDEPEPPQPSPEPSPGPDQPNAPAGGQAATPEPEPEPETAPLGGDRTPVEPAEPNTPNKAQLGMMFALFGRKGPSEREERLAYCERAVGRKIGSSKELTALDVTRIIEALNAEPDPPAAPAQTEPDHPDPPTAEPGFGERPAGIPTDLPPDEQAVMDALADELDAKPVDEPFPEGY